MKHMRFVIIFLLLFQFSISSLKADIINDDYIHEYLLGYEKLSSGNFEAAFDIWIEQALKGNYIAQTAVGKLYFSEKILRNYSEGIYWLNEAAKQNYPEAQFLLGGVYFYGRDAIDGQEVIQVDYIKALKYLKSASEAGNGEAQYLLSLMYFNGAGVQKNPAESIKWLKLAGENNIIEAQRELSFMYFEGEYLEKNDTLATQWLKRAAENGDEEAQFAIGSFYREGLYLEKNKLEAFSWFLKSAIQGFSDAQYNLSMMYWSGDGIEKDDVLAVAWMKLSAQNGNDKANEFLEIYKVTISKENYLSGLNKAASLESGDFNESENTYNSGIADIDSQQQSSTPTSAELLAAQQEAEALKQQLAELQSQQSQTQQATSSDTQIPLITITRADTDDKQGIVVGRVSDNVGVAEVTVDGNVVPLSSNGGFEYSTYVPATGKTVEVQVTDLAGLSSSQTVTLERNVNLATASISFDELNPIAKPAKRNNNALALIIGVSDYRNTPAKAIFADSDAMVFRDYASEKLGIPDNRIKTLVNDGADEREMLLAVQSWLSRSVKQDQTDVYVFFAGHGLASDDGQNMYLLPYDGSPELLDRTAILRDELFSDIAKANPRSVTVFLDTCYSGSNRGSEMLIADARPILLKAKDTSVPEGFTVFTAAAGDETAKSLEEAKHGLFSYFLMKGMEGDADTNGDKQITAEELHSYVKSNVVQQSSGTQTPELQGDADRVLVRFQ